jgi:hypothetical protein
VQRGWLKRTGSASRLDKGVQGSDHVLDQFQVMLGHVVDFPAIFRFDEKP